MERARRRRVPAFGEWNYNYSDEPWMLTPTGATAVGRCYSTHAAETEACSDVWFSYSPPSRKPAPKKVRRRPESGGVVAPQRPQPHHDGKGRRSRSRASDGSGMATTSVKAVRTVLRRVDADLYQVPPPDFGSHSHQKRPRKRVMTSMWKGCLGLNNCVA